MIGLDTNVLVRYLAQDDPGQASAATRLIERFTDDAPGFISTVALVETVWVLSHAYRTPRTEIVPIIEGLLRSKEIVVEQAEIHYAAFGGLPVHGRGLCGHHHRAKREKGGLHGNGLLRPPS